MNPATLWPNTLIPPASAEGSGSRRPSVHMGMVEGLDGHSASRRKANANGGSASPPISERGPQGCVAGVLRVKGSDSACQIQG